MNGFNTTLNQKSNGALANGVFELGMANSRPVYSYDRLKEALQEKLRPKGAPLLPMEIKVAMEQASHSILNNWEKRGISRDGVLVAQRKYQINPEWLKTGQGMKFLLDLTNHPKDVREKAFAEAIRSEANGDPYAKIEKALRMLVIVGSDKDEVLALIKDKAAKSAEIQKAMRELTNKASQ